MVRFSESPITVAVRLPTFAKENSPKRLLELSRLTRLMRYCDISSFSPRSSTSVGAINGYSWKLLIICLSSSVNPSRCCSSSSREEISFETTCFSCSASFPVTLSYFLCNYLNLTFKSLILCRFFYDCSTYTPTSPSSTT